MRLAARREAAPAGLRYRTARPPSRSARPQHLEIRAGHQADQLLEGRLRLPAEVALRLGGIADQMVDLRRSHERRVDHDVPLEVSEAGLVERALAALAHGVRLARRDHVVLGGVLLEHQPHRFDVVLGVAPIAFGVEVAEADLLGDAVLDRRRVPGDLAGDELKATAWPLVVKKYPRRRMQVVGLAVVDGYEVAVGLAQ